MKQLSSRLDEGILAQVNGGIVLSREFERNYQMLWAVLDDLTVLHLYDPVGLT